MANNIQIPFMTTEKFETDAKPNFLKVFNLPCTLIAPFTSLMASRMVAYCQIYLDAELLDPIVEVASHIGENGFYFSFVEDCNYEIWYPGLSGKGSNPRTWFIPFSNLRFYKEQTFLTSHVLYSSQGKWGAYISYEDFMVLGGVPEVVSGIKKRITKVDALTSEFLEDQKNKFLFGIASLEWIPKLLNHIYDSDETKRLLREHSMTNLVRPTS